MVFLNKLNYKIINVLFIVLIIFFISLSISFYENIIFIILDVIFPIFLSFFIGYSLYPFAFILSKKFSYNVSSFFVLFLVFLLFFILFYLIVSIFSNDLIYFFDEVLLFLSKFSISFDFTSYFKRFLSLDFGISLFNSGASFITSFLFILILTIYFLFNMRNIKQYFSRFSLFCVIDNDLFNYYKGFYLVILIEILEYFVIYYLIGHPYYLFIAILSGVTSVIPFFGALFTNFIALITSISGGSLLFILTSVFMIIVPIFNSYFVEPKVYNKTLKVPLIAIVVSCFLFGSLFGFWGTFFAIPLYLIIKNLFLFFFSKESLI